MNPVTCVSTQDIHFYWDTQETRLQNERHREGWGKVPTQGYLLVYKPGRKQRWRVDGYLFLLNGRQKRRVLTHRKRTRVDPVSSLRRSLRWVDVETYDSHQRVHTTFDLYPVTDETWPTVLCPEEVRRINHLIRKKKFSTESVCPRQ